MKKCFKCKIKDRKDKDTYCIECRLLYCKEYFLKNKDKIKQKRSSYQVGYNLLRRSRLIEDRLKIINHYTKGKNKCQCCGENNVRFLSVDHSSNNGTTHIKEIKMVNGGTGRFYKWIIKNNFPKDLQILCYNCNLGKARYGGICPHKI